MTNHPVLASFLTDLATRHENMVRNLLMALGGGLVGAIVTGVACYVAFKAVRVKKVPPRFLMIASLIGGFLVGWLVWAWFAGGVGYGPGPGGGIVGGTETSKGLPSTSRDTAPVLPSQKEIPPDTLRIHVVRSQDYEPESKRYYLLGGKGPAHNLAETLQAIQQRQQKGPELKTIDVVFYQDSMADTRGIVAQLEEGLRPLGLKPNTLKLAMPSP